MRPDMLLMSAKVPIWLRTAQQRVAAFYSVLHLDSQQEAWQLLCGPAYWS